MLVQINDDKNDVLEDFPVQVNSFVALVRDLGLEKQLNAYYQLPSVKLILERNSRFDSLRDFFENYVKGRLGKQGTEQIELIKNQYLAVVTQPL